MQLRGWNTAIAAAVAGVVGTVAFTYQALVKRWDTAAAETGARATVGAA